MAEVDKKLGEFGAEIATLKGKVSELDNDFSRASEQHREGLFRIEKQLTSIEARLSSKPKSDTSRDRQFWMLVGVLIAALFLENEPAMQFIKGFLK